MEVVSGDNWSSKDLQSSSQIVATNKPTHNFLQTGFPCCCRTNSIKAVKGYMYVMYTHTYRYTYAPGFHFVLFFTNELQQKSNSLKVFSFLGNY